MATTRKNDETGFVLPGLAPRSPAVEPDFPSRSTSGAPLESAARRVRPPAVDLRGLTEPPVRMIRGVTFAEAAVLRSVLREVMRLRRRNDARDRDDDRDD
jgi:hypothetical protein